MHRNAGLLTMVGLLNLTEASYAAPLHIEITAPNHKLSTLPTSGWRLSFELSPNGPNARVVAQATTRFEPHDGSSAWMILQDPDQCFSQADPSCPNNSTSQEAEKFLSFTLDVDSVGTIDTAGNSDLRTRLHDSSRYPILTDYNNTGWVLGPIEPFPFTTPLPPLDGMGYGADDDLPGLVILSSVGVGKQRNTKLTLPIQQDIYSEAPTAARNLAGWITEVVYTGNNDGSNPKLEVHLDAPAKLFAPITLIDLCTQFRTNSNLCTPTPNASQHYLQYPWILSSDGYEYSPGNYHPLVFPFKNRVHLELRIVIVSGVAPTFISDCNEDNTFTAFDLSCEGYEVLSNEALISFDIEFLIAEQYATEFSRFYTAFDIASPTPDDGDDAVIRILP